MIVETTELKIAFLLSRYDRILLYAIPTETYKVVTCLLKKSRIRSIRHAVMKGNIVAACCGTHMYIINLKLEIELQKLQKDGSEESFPGIVGLIVGNPIGLVRGAAF